MVISALHVANSLIKRAIETKTDMSPMKLQKMLYFVYKRYLQKTRSSLFGDRFAPWRYGPVQELVYQEFKDFKTRSINRYFTESDGTIIRVNEKSSKEFRDAFEYVWQAYSEYDGIRLSNLTHKKGSAWYKALEQGKSYLDDDNIIAEEWFK